MTTIAMKPVKTFRPYPGMTPPVMPALVSNHALADEVEDDYADQRTQDIMQREWQHQHAAECFVFRQTEQGQASWVDTQDREVKQLVDQLSRAHMAIVNTKHAPCAETAPWCPAPNVKFRQYRTTRLGKRLHACAIAYLTLEERTPDWLIAYSDYVFSPQVTVMLRALKRHAKRIGQWLAPDDEACEGTFEMDAVHALEHLVALVRRVSGSWPFINACKKVAAKAKSNFNSGRNFIFKLFTRRSRLLVLRVDLYFRPWAKALGLSSQADVLIEKFVRRLRDERIVGNYLGAIYKREDGVSRGAHWHWLIFLDGHLRQDAYGLSRKIGEDWMRLAGKHQSSYFNCYVKANRFKFNGLGLVHVNDAKKLLGLRAALVYLTKRDCVLKLDAGKDQHFRRSKPRYKAETKRGAKRKDVDSLATLRRIFAGHRETPLNAFAI